MAHAGIPGVTEVAVAYVQRALSLDLSEDEAAATFAGYIEESGKCAFNQFNFVIHSFMQTNRAEGRLFSFTPHTHM